MLPLNVLSRYRRWSSRLRHCRRVKMRNPMAYISFTFDDFPRSALATGGAILSHFGMKGTYYASLGLMGQSSPVGPLFSAEDLNGVLIEGHELGCHTYAHCDA